MERIDLHTHTLASDGSDTPAAVVQQAAALGLRAVAVTDHDTFAGLPEALAAGQRCGIEVVPGVELSTVWGGEEVHLLGYFMDTGNAALRALMTRATDERNARNETMVQRLHVGLPHHDGRPARGLPGADGARPAAHRGAARAARVHRVGAGRHARPAWPGQGVLRPAL